MLYLAIISYFSNVTLLKCKFIIERGYRRVPLLVVFRLILKADITDCLNVQRAIFQYIQEENKFNSNSKNYIKPTRLHFSKSTKKAFNLQRAWSSPNTLPLRSVVYGQVFRISAPDERAPLSTTVRRCASLWVWDTRNFTSTQNGGYEVANERLL